ncbi:MAG: radical SAM protein [Candidatus Aegiribacteria sp.]|nr:radical SAM protein [Candidatus Aegiribacteria sp.]
MSASYWVSPREANLLITGRCNLRCRHCSVTSHGELNTDLPLSEWINILDELSRSKLLKLTITGGEPLYRPDLPEFLAEVYKRPFRFSINTNGTLITPRIIETVKRFSSRLNEFMVSLDGPDMETVDSQRGEGVFEKLLSGVKKLRAAEFPFGFYCTVTSINVEKLNETAEFALSLGAEWIKFNNFVLAGPVLNHSMIPGHARVNRAAGRLSIPSIKYPGRIQGSILDMRERVLKYKAGELRKTKNRAYSCGGGRGKIAVFPDGRVTPCDHIPDITLGNITGQSLEEILTGDVMKRFTGFMAQPRSDYPACKNCGHIDYCTGGCPVEPLSRNESIGFDRHSCLRLALEEK